jgi:hypothetical protein
MYLMDSKKKALTAILGPDSDNVGVRGEDGAPEEGASDLHAIAGDLIDCMHAKDVDGVVAALQAAHNFCSGGMVKGE